MATVTLTARVENSYPETGDDIVTRPQATLPVPPVPLTPGQQITPELDAWLHRHLFGMTGTGRTRGKAYYGLTVTASSRPDLVPVGFTHSWGY